MGEKKGDKANVSDDMDGIDSLDAAAYVDTCAGGHTAKLTLQLVRGVMCLVLVLRTCVNLPTDPPSQYRVLGEGL